MSDPLPVRPQQRHHPTPASSTQPPAYTIRSQANSDPDDKRHVRFRIGKIGGIRHPLCRDSLSLDDKEVFGDGMDPEGGSCLINARPGHQMRDQMVWAPHQVYDRVSEGYLDVAMVRWESATTGGKFCQMRVIPKPWSYLISRGDVPSKCTDTRSSIDYRPDGMFDGHKIELEKKISTTGHGDKSYVSDISAE
ncbi:hypothetical protein V3481_006801 [Fusarium oxysporum f. sp. vasinfectum]